MDYKALIQNPESYNLWAERDIYPNFLIAGAAKAGTTSLYEYLRQHPEVFMPTDPKRKEPHFFVHNKTAAFQDLSEYLTLFQSARGKKAIGEASTGYLYSPESARWIRSVLGRIKIIILLRNPAKRAFSLWANMVRDGFEDATTFEEALRREPDRLRSPDFEDQCLQTAGVYAYFGSGLYSSQVERYFDTFGPENVCVHLFEDIVKDPARICRDVFRFLEVDDAFEPKIAIHNQGGAVPRFIPLQYRLQSVALGRAWMPYLSLVPRRRRGALIRKLERWNIRIGPAASLSKPLYRELMDRYQPDIERLEQLLGRDLSIWSGPAGEGTRAAGPASPTAIGEAK